MADVYGTVYVPGPRSRRVPAAAQLILAIWLFVSPWVLHFAAATGSETANAPGLAAEAHFATWNAWISAALIVIAAVIAIAVAGFWQERIALVLGAWVFAAPWVLGFNDLPPAAWDHWMVGLFVFLFAAWALPSATQEPYRPSRF